MEAKQRSIAYSATTNSKLLLVIALNLIFFVYMNLPHIGILYSIFGGEVSLRGG